MGIRVANNVTPHLKISLKEILNGLAISFPRHHYSDELCFLFQRVDTEAEEILLADSKDISTEELSSNVPEDQPRYHFFLFKHTHEGDYMETIGSYMFFLVGILLQIISGVLL